MVSQIVNLLSKFPLKTYLPEDITDTPLQNELANRTFYYGYDKHDSLNFTLLIGEYELVGEDKIVVSMDPDCLFLQCVLAKKHGIMLPRDTTPINKCKILSVNSENVPMLIVDSTTKQEEGGNYMTHRELLQDVNEKYMSIKEKQWARLLDTKVKQIWLEQKQEGSPVCTSAKKYHEMQCYNTLQLFEKQYTQLTRDHHIYLQLKLDTLLFCILESNVPTPIQHYIKMQCPTLASVSLPLWV